MSDIYEIHDSVLREHESPREGHEPIPVWLVFIAFATMAVAGYILGRDAVGFSAERSDMEPAPIAVAAVADDKPVDTVALGKKIFTRCAQCHRSDGRGAAGLYPPLAGSSWVTGSEERLVRIVLHGVSGPIEVLGETYNSRMQGWSFYSDTEISAVLTHIRSQWGNEAPPVTPETVARIRAETADRDRPWRAAELLLIEDLEPDEGQRQ